jgi:hypothetical protein
MSGGKHYTEQALTMEMLDSKIDKLRDLTRLAQSSDIVGIIFPLDSGGTVITTGLKMGLVIPFACIITQATTIGVLPADTAGSIVLDIWKTTYAGAPPLNAHSITASAPPTITAARKSQDSTLTGWTTTVAAGDVLFVYVDSCSTFTAVTLVLKAKGI